MKISIIGSSGKVGIETTRLLAEQNNFLEHVNVILYSPNNAKKITGFLLDLEEGLLIRDKIFAKNINFLPINRSLTTEEKEQIGEIPNSSVQLICDIKQNRITPMPTFISNNNINKIKEGANFIEQELQKLEIQTPLITNERNR